MRLISIVAVLGLLACSGCGRQSKNEDKTPLLGADKKRAIEVARSHLEKSDDKDDEFSVAVFKRDEDSWEYWVSVNFVYGHYETGEPKMMPGGHCTIIVSHDFKVKRVIPGK